MQGVSVAGFASGPTVAEGLPLRVKNGSRCYRLVYGAVEVRGRAVRIFGVCVCVCAYVRCIYIYIIILYIATEYKLVIPAIPQVCVYTYIHIPTYLSVYPSIYLSVYLSI